MPLSAAWTVVDDPAGAHLSSLCHLDFDLIAPDGFLDFREYCKASILNRHLICLTFNLIVILGFVFKFLPQYWIHLISVGFYFVINFHHFCLYIMYHDCKLLSVLFSHRKTVYTWCLLVYKVHIHKCNRYLGTCSGYAHKPIIPICFVGNWKLSGRDKLSVRQGEVEKKVKLILKTHIEHEWIMWMNIGCQIWWFHCRSSSLSLCYGRTTLFLSTHCSC